MKMSQIYKSNWILLPIWRQGIVQIGRCYIEKDRGTFLNDERYERGGVPTSYFYLLTFSSFLIQKDSFLLM